MRVLILGASGLIGSSMMRVLSESSDLQVFGTTRDRSALAFYPSPLQDNIFTGMDMLHDGVFVKLLGRVRPDIVINCAGLTKHKPEADDPVYALPINSLLPHRLSDVCRLAGARLIHISTDCVFSGEKGNYIEDDFPDARDVYGKSKILGEVVNDSGVTLRTSTIGHEFLTKFGLLNWFLSQKDSCRGFRRAIFSGLPTVVLAQVIRDVVIPNKDLVGLYHLGAQAINKFDLLSMIGDIYGHPTSIIPDDDFVIDRSLSSEKFRVATGYVAPPWPELISLMHTYQ